MIVQNIDVVCAWASTLSIECVRMTVKESTYYSYSSLPRTRLYQLYVNMQCTWLPACWQPSHGPAHDVHGHQPAGNHHANTWGGQGADFHSDLGNVTPLKMPLPGPLCCQSLSGQKCEPHLRSSNLANARGCFRNCFTYSIPWHSYFYCFQKS